MTAAELLRESRRRHGVTQAQLAARARTSQAAISRIKRDLVSPTVETLATLLDLMGEELELGARAISNGPRAHCASSVHGCAARPSTSPFSSRSVTTRGRQLHIRRE